jgi:hypothetical protein
MDRLERTGAFTQVGSPIEEHVNEQGQVQATLDVVYAPESGHAAGRGQGAGRR